MPPDLKNVSLLFFYSPSTSQESICHENKNSNCSNLRNYEFEVFKINLKSPEKEISYQSNTLVTQAIGDQLPINLIEEYGEIGYRVFILGLQKTFSCPLVRYFSYDILGCYQENSLTFFFLPSQKKEVIAVEFFQ